MYVCIYVRMYVCMYVCMYTNNIRLLELLGHNSRRGNILELESEVSPRYGQDLIPLHSPIVGNHFGDGGDVGDSLVFLHREDQLHHTHVVTMEGQSTQLLLALLLPEHLDTPPGRIRHTLHRENKTHLPGRIRHTPERIRHTLRENRNHG